ncbi:protein PML isoform X3 [Dipodomys merriami]|uniref:protein PML isoform X3 n=1 Tax=Dipodomys merriami TaxID=94247 RepID=UPI003855B212
MLKSPPPAWSPDREPEPGPQPEPPARPHPGASPGGPQPSPSPAEPTMEEEFRFLLCQGCHTLAKCPKLLTCLHTLCSGCLDAHGLQCPTCQESQPPDPKEEALDNVFFESLQRRLSLYQQIVEAQALCTRCKEPAVFWCFECEQLLCTKCFEAHQWFLKHEARPLTELRDQTAREFLDGTRKTNNIFCSNPNHRTPALTSIYCRGCSKPLCCSCALLDAGHSDLKCDLGAEVRQRQEELRATAQALQEREHTFADAHAQVRAALSQLGCARADTEELIRASVRQAVARVQAREHALLEALEARFQLERTKLADQLQRLDTVLQRMRTGGALVQRLELYASDQEVLDMHGFLQGALDRLRQEEPEGPGAPRDPGEPRSFAEIEVQLQDLVSCITNAVLTREASPEASSMPQNSLDVELPREEQRTETQSLSQAETQLVAMEQSEPSAPPVPRYNFCMTGPSFREEGSGINPPKKRKSCYTQCPKIIKMESEDEKEARLSASSPEYPIPSTSRAVPHPHLGVDGPPSPERPRLGQEILLPQSNHVTSDDPESGEPVVVISSSDDSEPENLGASHACWASQLPQGTCCPPAWHPCHPAEPAAVPSPEPPGQPADRQEHATTLQGSSSARSHRAPRAAGLHHVLSLPRQWYCAPRPPCSRPRAQAATLATTGPSRYPGGQQTVLRLPCQVHRTLASLRASPQLKQWLSNFFNLSSHLNASPPGVHP